ncbi:uncharacterized protein LOC127443884 [Myxocyprinus asiaticus]|uniref:uncharacterized protein LOC127443884 n=1 Tax=Myxocyprinus asiaticus TaxID=70543 RepID=UPI00222208CC|nr:uncharacterized protein LOC127443884 [Myxocyprinus asiaticus]XP_051558856.1 uncharacterized protein LOC127443884 [Myxocyprinus asiaticus]
MDDWTKEDVHQWLTNAIKIPQKYADILCNEDVSGASLILFNKQDFLDIGLKHGPAVQILKKVAQFKASSVTFKNSGIPEDTSVGQVWTSTIEYYQQDKTAVKGPTSGATELEVTPHLSIQENGDGKSSVQRWPFRSEDVLEEQDDHKYKEGAGDSSSQSNKSPCRHCTKQTSTNNVRSETKELLSNITSNLRTEPNKMDDWTKEDVHQWLTNAVKVPQKYADILCNEDVSGASLILFNKQDFLDVGLKHGPAVQILKKVAQFKASSENLKNSGIPEDTSVGQIWTSTIEHYQQDKTAVKRPISGATELEVPPHLSIQENGDGKSSVQRWPFRSEDVLEEQDDHKYKEGAGDSSSQSNKSPCRHCTKQTSINNVRSETKELPSNITSNLRTEPNKMDDWTKEDVHQWLTNAIKVPQRYADILCNEDVSGASLILFNKQDFLDVGLKHGPAVQILKKVAQFKASSENLKNSGIPEDTSVGQVWTSTIEHYQQDKTAVKRPISGSTELEVPLSIQENRDGTPSIQRCPQASEDIPKHKDNGGESYPDTALVQKDELKFEEHDLKDKKECGASDVQQFPVTYCTKPTNKNTLCAPRPFDKISTTFEYKQNEILPPETGPSNLIDPVHEYKLLVHTENASEKDILKKFTDEVFWFAAGCLNYRTNGTIHFGVGDEPQYKHGQIIGLELRSPKDFIDAFDRGLKEHFKGHTVTAMACIRPPKFFKVKCPDNIKVDRWVIEVDVVPKYKLTLEKLFYTTIDKKRRKSKCFFIRLGANTTNHIPEKDPRTVKQNMKTLKNSVKCWASFRKLAEKGYKDQALARP